MITFEGVCTTSIREISSLCLQILRECSRFLLTQLSLIISFSPKRITFSRKRSIRMYWNRRISRWNRRIYYQANSRNRAEEMHYLFYRSLISPIDKIISSGRPFKTVHLPQAGGSSLPKNSLHGELVGLGLCIALGSLEQAR